MLLFPDLNEYILSNVENGGCASPFVGKLSFAEARYLPSSNIGVYCMVGTGTSIYESILVGLIRKELVYW